MELKGNKKNVVSKSSTMPRKSNTTVLDDPKFTKKKREWFSFIAIKARSENGYTKLFFIQCIKQHDALFAEHKECNKIFKMVLENFAWNLMDRTCGLRNTFIKS